MNFLKDKAKILIPIAAVILVVAILAIIIFTRPNLKIDDIKSPTKAGVLMQYGIPTDDFGTDEWSYHECIKFCDIEIDYVSVDFDKKEIFFTEFDADDQDDLFDAIDHYCDFERSASGLFYEYSYGDIEIRVAPDGSYVNFVFY